MNIETAILERKAPSKLTDLLTLGLYGMGIGAGAVMGLMVLLLVA